MTTTQTIFALATLSRCQHRISSATLADTVRRSPSTLQEETPQCYVRVPILWVGAHRPCSLCFCALCPEAAKINTAPPNLIQQQNKTIGAVNQNDKSSTYQTTRGNNRLSAPCALPPPGSLLGCSLLGPPPCLCSPCSPWAFPSASLGPSLAPSWRYLGFFGPLGLRALFSWSRRSLRPIAANTNTAVKQPI